MSTAGAWSVKGIDPKAREIARDLARRSGLTLGEWLNQMITDTGDEPPPALAPAYEREPEPALRGWADAPARAGLRAMLCVDPAAKQVTAPHPRFAAADKMLN